MINKYPTLYSFRRCPYAMRARLAIRLCKIQCIIREISLKAKNSEFLRVSPKATVPVLVLPNGNDCIKLVYTLLCLPDFLLKLTIFDVKEKISGLEYLSFNKSLIINVTFSDPPNDFFRNQSWIIAIFESFKYIKNFFLRLILCY